MKIKEVYSKDEEKSLKVGLWVALSLILVTGLVATARSKVSHVEDGKYYAVTARFNRTDGLLVGDLVRLAGMNIGKVVDAKLGDSYKAVLTLEINEKIKLPDDSSASIVSSGIMGPKYIEIEPGGSEDLITPGGEFAYTQDAMVIEELLDRIVSIGKANRHKQPKTGQISPESPDSKLN